MKRLAISGALLLLVTPTVRAQEATPVQTAATEAPAPAVAADVPIVPATPEQTSELTRWLKDASAWQKWDQQWRGIAQWSWSGGVAERRQEPAPPVWMPQACTDFREGRIAATQLLVDACELSRQLARNYYDLIAEEIDRERQWYRKQHEDVDKSWFLSRLHLDTPYIMAQSNGWRIFSYFGVHITPFDIKKRVYVWLPPGLSLISMPDGDRRKIMPAYGAGLSVRWFDFRFPGAPKPSTMYFNIAEFFIQDSTIPGASNKLTMMGLSFTAKKPK